MLTVNAAPGKDQEFSKWRVSGHQGWGQDFGVRISALLPAYSVAGDAINSLLGDGPMFRWMNPVHNNKHN